MIHIGVQVLHDTAHEKIRFFLALNQKGMRKSITKKKKKKKKKNKKKKTKKKKKKTTTKIKP
jgi:hypothetical protein